MAMIRNIQSAPRTLEPSPTVSRYSSADWERHRGQICRLYRQHILKDVMKIMAEEHDFTPTAKAYKGHLKLWDETKYLKPHEVDTELSRMAGANGGDQTFQSQIRNRAVTLQQLQRSKKRRRIRQNTCLTARETAEPEPQALTPHEHTTSICPSPTQPMVYSQPQQAFYWLYKYLTATTWRSTDKWPYALPGSMVANDQAQIWDVCNSLDDDRIIACSISSSGQLEGPSQAKRHVRNLISSLDIVATFGELSEIGVFVAYVLAVSADNPQIALFLLRKLVNAYEKYQPRSHPVYLFFQQLSRLDSAALLDVLGCAAQLSYEGLADALGPSHPAVDIARFNYIGGALYLRGPGVEIAGWRSFLKAFDNRPADSDCDGFILGGHLRLADALANMGSFDARIHVAKQAVARFPGFGVNPAWLLLSHCDFILGNEQDAIDRLSLCLERLEQCGIIEFRSWKVFCEVLLIKFERDLRNAGYRDCAARCEEALARMVRDGEMCRQMWEERLSRALGSLKITTSNVRADDEPDLGGPIHVK